MMLLFQQVGFIAEHPAMASIAVEVHYTPNGVVLSNEHVSGEKAPACPPRHALRGDGHAWRAQICSSLAFLPVGKHAGIWYDRDRLKLNHY